METAIPKLKAPIVLVHGLCGFDRVSACGYTLKDYFPGIRESLEASGNRVFVPRVSMTRGVADRAADLKRFIEKRIPNEPVHIIGHSMGGLDGRYLVSQLGFANRVRSLTTIGTPHRGTAFADWGVNRFGRLLSPFFQFLGVSSQAFLDLTTEGCRTFNACVPDVPGVRYFSVAGVCAKEWINTLWQLPHGIVSRAEGPNDGVVSVASAQWGESTDVWNGDHMNLVNWPNRYAQKRGLSQKFTPDYGRVIRKIAECE